MLGYFYREYMSTVESMIRTQAERYADVSYFPSVRSFEISSYVVHAAFEYARATGQTDELEDRISGEHSELTTRRASTLYLEESGVRGLGLGMFASASLNTGEHVVTLPWFMSKELVEEHKGISHAPVANELFTQLSTLNREVGHLRRTETYGYVLDFEERKTMFMIDSYRDTDILTSPRVIRGLRETLKRLPPIEVVLSGTTLNPTRRSRTNHS
jgi:hypothetical protein